MTVGAIVAIRLSAHEAEQLCALAARLTACNDGKGAKKLARGDAKDHVGDSNVRSDWDLERVTRVVFGVGYQRFMLQGAVAPSLPLDAVVQYQGNHTAPLLEEEHLPTDTFPRVL